MLAAAREAASRAQLEENRRLLYVAMTRAEDWLIVAGAKGRRQSDHADTWYGMVEAGLQRRGAAPAGDAAPSGLDGDVLRLAMGEKPRRDRPVASSESAPLSSPAWASAPPRTRAKGAVAKGCGQRFRPAA